MAAFTQRCPDDLHAAMRAFLNSRPWLNQNELVNGAISSMIGFPEYRVDTAPPTLDDYVRTGAMTEVQGNAIREALTRSNRIVIVGPKSSGKSSLLRAILREYQRLTNPARAMSVSVTNDASLANIQPLLATRLDHPDNRARGFTVPEWIEAAFVDGLGTDELSGLITAWRQGKSGAVTLEGTRFDWESDGEFNALVNVRILLGSDRKIVILLDNLLNQNIAEQMPDRQATNDVDREVDRLFDDIVAHFASMNRVARRGPNSGRSPSSMTRRASIAIHDRSIGLLEVATVMTSAASHKRVLTWTTNAVSPERRGSIVRELSSFEDAKSLIGP